MHTRTGPWGEIWQQANFRNLWTARMVSLVGSQTTRLALPLLAALLLAASPVQMGLLSAAASAPYSFVGLFVGVWIDRYPRRLILIVADLGRAALLGIVPLLALLGVLRIEWLYAVAFCTGTLTVIEDSAGVAFLPTLVRRDQLVAANSHLEAGRAGAEIVGPSVSPVR